MGCELRVGTTDVWWRGYIRNIISYMKMSDFRAIVEHPHKFIDDHGMMVDVIKESLVDAKPGITSGYSSNRYNIVIKNDYLGTIHEELVLLEDALHTILKRSSKFYGGSPAFIDIDEACRRYFYMKKQSVDIKRNFLNIKLTFDKIKKLTVWLPYSDRNKCLKTIEECISLSTNRNISWAPAMTTLCLKFSKPLSSYEAANVVQMFKLFAHINKEDLTIIDYELINEAAIYSI